MINKDKIRYVAFDVDGTLLRDDKSLAEETKQAIHRLQDKGIGTMLVSGRSVHSLQNFIETLRLDETEGYLIGINGGSIYDCKTQKFIYQEKIEPSLVEEYFGAWPKENLSRAAYREGTLFTDTPTKDDVNYLKRINDMTMVSVDSLAQPMEDIDKMMIAGFQENIEPHVDGIQERFAGRLYMTYSTAIYFEAMPLGIDKGVGLTNFAKMVGGSLDQILAFGDGDNDTPLLAAAGIGVAMDNATPATKAVADHITKSNEDNGIAHFLKDHGLLS